MDQEPHGGDHPAVVVELVLAAGAVAEPNRSAVGVARPVERSLGGYAAAVQREHWREPRPMKAARVQQPVEEGAGLSLEPDAEEGADADAGVARPPVAVAPVPAASELLGKRCCRRCDGGAGGGIGKQAQGDEAALDVVREWPVERDARRPPPPTSVVLQQRTPRTGRRDAGERTAMSGRQDDLERPLRVDRHLDGAPGFDRPHRCRRRRTARRRGRRTPHRRRFGVCAGGGARRRLGD